MTSLAIAVEALPTLTPAQWCQVFFSLSSAAVLAIQAIPEAAQHALLDYGARSPVGADDQTKGSGNQATNWFNELVKAIASVGQIPHSWFMHFYVASVIGSFFWAFQFLSGGQVIGFIAARQAQSQSPAMSLDQTVLIWSLMTLQGTRRLYECFFVTKPGSSRMWFVHWLLGLGFYLCMSVSVWIDGSGESFLTASSPAPTDLSPASLQAATGPRFGRLPSPTTVVGTAMYLYGWSNQHMCHKHLASLKKYSLPDQGLFRYLVCPHYTCECLVYLGIAIAAAPGNQWINRTLLCAFWFIVANLGTTANGTKKWYAQKFGAEKVASRWKMIPFIF